jgi:hypothetical protein
MHAYFREKILWSRYHGKYASKPQSSSQFKLPYGLLDLSIPSAEYFIDELSKFGFFFFVPTLVYREHYPRTSRIRWSFALCRLAEVMAIIYYAFLIFRHSLPQFMSDFGPDSHGVKLDMKTFTKRTFACMYV